MKSERLVIKYEGENDIDLETLTLSLNATMNTLKEMAEQLITENDHCKFKVMNIEKGSFVITIDQILDLAPTLMVSVPTVISAFKQILEIRKLLKGQTPKEVIKRENNVEIKNKDGNVYYADSMVFNIYNNTTEKELAEVAKSVALDKDRNGLKYEFEDVNGKKDCIMFNKEELGVLSIPQDVDAFDKAIEENDMITYVVVRKPDLKGNSKWVLTLNGKNITCDISDQNFLDRVHNNEIPFRGDTKMKVRMIVRYRARGLSDKAPEILSRNIIDVLEVE